VVAGHALLECFSVLTRLPPPLAASAASVEQVLSGFLSGGVELADTSAAACRLIISELARRGLGGGRIYDGIIALCSFEAGATVLLTWNLNHFLSVAPSGLRVMEPAPK
jgi:predicted nucleic acid-binding protein